MFSIIDYETTRHDEIINEPILESWIITLKFSIKIFLLPIYGLFPEPLNLEFSSQNLKNWTLLRSGHGLKVFLWNLE